VASDHHLETAWSDLAAVRSLFNGKSWLSSKTRSWVRTIELTHGAEGWHPHDNLLVFAPDLDGLKETIVARWLSSADRAGVQAEAVAQYIEPARSTTAVRRYIAKGWMGYSADLDAGRTPGDLLFDRFTDDDPLAADLWNELESFIERHRGSLRLSQRGGSLRGRQALRRPDYDLCA
jgi:hypothetical protein